MSQRQEEEEAYCRVLGKKYSRGDCEKDRKVPRYVVRTSLNASTSPLKPRPIKFLRPIRPILGRNSNGKLETDLDKPSTSSPAVANFGNEKLKQKITENPINYRKNRPVPSTTSVPQLNLIQKQFDLIINNADFRPRGDCTVRRVKNDDRTVQVPAKRLRTVHRKEQNGKCTVQNETRNANCTVRKFEKKGLRTVHNDEQRMDFTVQQEQTNTDCTVRKDSFKTDCIVQPKIRNGRCTVRERSNNCDTSPKPSTSIPTCTVQPTSSPNIRTVQPSISSTSRTVLVAPDGKRTVQRVSSRDTNTSLTADGIASKTAAFSLAHLPAALLESFSALADGESSSAADPTQSTSASSPLKRPASESPEPDAEAKRKASEQAVRLFADLKAVLDHSQPNQEGLQYPCGQCERTFSNDKMLQQHQQSFHAEKNFVCEICNKAFRFRSNLAEHRSVHTAVKPFVCRFCGKSSRLKGNLTKHILKHHRSEQIEHIGTDDIIIKKGKKSVKDPAAIDFLEKSMIVLNPDGTPVNGNGVPSRPEYAAQPLSRNSTSNLSASDGSATPMENKLDTPLNGFLLSFGLDAGSLDLKGDSSDDRESDSSGLGNSTNDQLLEKCNQFMNMSANDQPEIENEEKHDDSTDDGSVCHSSGSNVQNLNALFYSAANALNNTNNTHSLAEFNKAVKADEENKNGGAPKPTQCPECGKHVRKPKDLITHLATIHNISPANPDEKTDREAPNESIKSDVRQLLQIVGELKATSSDCHKMEQTVNLIDGRVGRLEKQLEMALNSIYTLVQLQTGVNNQVTRFRDDASEQLNRVIELLEGKTTK
ncbi:unnamed protein product [Bursaphelenchus xylophilus]|uniref:(pine wood nematode) hypothetical protein n=1 Tax=Bursaphelenchus xylophilus TaxID=6326 RepID=A0A1I7SKZ1_BURXY|nr:unnamed protein product [Bursaphelenchus xylophilus]CAG9129306.1 unnamed protein product [Bursaphelenchus xylophilus]